MKILKYAIVALVIISYPVIASAMTIGDVEQQLNLYKSQTQASVIDSSISLGQTNTPPVPMPPTPVPTISPAPKTGGTDIHPLPPTPAPSTSDTGSRFQLTPEQVKVIMQGLKTVDGQGTSMIINTTIVPGQADTKGGSSIKGLQIFLNGAGCNLPTTGFFGNLTKKCVKDFQKRKGLKQDGIVGPNFRKAMAAEIDTATTSSVTSGTTPPIVNTQTQ